MVPGGSQMGPQFVSRNRPGLPMAQRGAKVLPQAPSRRPSGAPEAPRNLEKPMFYYQKTMIFKKSRFFDFNIFYEKCGKISKNEYSALLYAPTNEIVRGKR